MLDTPVVVQATLGRRVVDRDDATDGNDELVAEALATWDAGAAMLQLSLPETDGGGSGRWVALSRVIEGIRSAGCDAVLSLSSRPGVEASTTPQDARSHLDIDLVSLDCRSAVARGNEQDWLASLRERAFAIANCGMPLEVQCSNAQDVKRVLELRDEGFLADPLRFQLVIDARSEDSPVEQLTRATEVIPPGAIWFASALGLAQLPANVYALVAGGHLRTGLEDNLWLVEDVPATDEELVQRVVRIVDELDRPLATPEEAREVLRLSGDREPDDDTGGPPRRGSSDIDERLIASLG